MSDLIRPVPESDTAHLLSRTSYDEIDLHDDTSLDNENATVLYDCDESNVDCPPWLSTWPERRELVAYYWRKFRLRLAVLAITLVSAILLLTIVEYTHRVPILLEKQSFYLDSKSAPRERMHLEHKWVIEETQTAGIAHAIYVTNGRVPGPSLQLCIGDTVTINVTNRLTQPLSIHWHGISQHASNDQDGAASVTQKAIELGQSFEYSFTADRKGTFWWHAHCGTVRLDGVYGALIVHDRMHAALSYESAKIEEYDLADLVLLAGDWYSATSAQLESAYLSESNTNRLEPQADGMIVNGQIWQNSTIIEFNVPKDARQRRYLRVRFVNVGALAELKISCHSALMVMEADATAVAPVSVGSLSIAVGQRYSLMIDTNDLAKNATVLLTIELDSTSHSAHDHGSNTEHAHNHGSASTNKSHSQHHHLSSHVNSSITMPIVHHLDEGDLHPASISGLHTHAANRTVPNYHARPIPPLYTLSLGSRRTNDTTRSTINGLFYSPSPSSRHPLIDHYQEHATLENTTGLSTKYGTGIQSLSIRQDEEVLLLFLNEAGGGGNHPMHIHGHGMQVLATQSFFYDPAAPGKRPARSFDPAAISSVLRTAEEGMLEERAIWRDTINVVRDGWTLVRVRGGGKGVWALHCHAMWHELDGMAMILEVR